MKTTGYTTGRVRAFDKEEALKTRTIEFVISDASRDRYHTVCNPGGWALGNFNRNGIVGYQHNVYGDMCHAPNPDDVIGVGRAWVADDQLIGSVTFEPEDLNPLAEKIFRKVLHGTLNATSVGFRPLPDEHGSYGRWGDGDEAEGQPHETYYYHAQELLEFSIVNIPANPNALVRSVREQTSHALMYLRRATGLSFADIERMTVRDVMDALEGNTTPERASTQEPPVLPEATPEVESVDVVALRAALNDVMTGGMETRVRDAIRAALA